MRQHFMITILESGLRVRVTLTLSARVNPSNTKTRGMDQNPTWGIYSLPPAGLSESGIQKQVAESGSY